MEWDECFSFLGKKGGGRVKTISFNIFKGVINR